MSHAETKLVLVQLQEERVRNAMLVDELEQLKKKNTVLRQQALESEITYDNTLVKVKKERDDESKRYADLKAVHDAHCEGNERAFQRLHAENSELQVRLSATTQALDEQRVKYEEQLSAKRTADMFDAHNFSESLYRLRREKHKLKDRVSELEEQLGKKPKVEVVEREVLVLY